MTMLASMYYVYRSTRLFFSLSHGSILFFLISFMLFSWYGVYRIRIGETFVTVSNEDAEEFVNDKKEIATAEVASVEPRIQANASEMDQLRTVLYSKFGTNINLDNDPDDMTSHLRK